MIMHKRESDVQSGTNSRVRANQTVRTPGGDASIAVILRKHIYFAPAMAARDAERTARWLGKMRFWRVRGQADLGFGLVS
jgi:hypothetical protein